MTVLERATEAYIHREFGTRKTLQIPVIGDVV